MTAVRLLAELRAAGYPGGYTQLREYVRKVRPRPPAEPLVHFETDPGVQGQAITAPEHVGRDGRIPRGPEGEWLRYRELVGPCEPLACRTETCGRAYAGHDYLGPPRGVRCITAADAAPRCALLAASRTVIAGVGMAPLSKLAQVVCWTMGTTAVADDDVICGGSGHCVIVAELSLASGAQQDRVLPGSVAFPAGGQSGECSRPTAITFDASRFHDSPPPHRLTTLSHCGKTIKCADAHAHLTGIRVRSRIDLAGYRAAVVSNPTDEGPRRRPRATNPGETAMP